MSTDPRELIRRLSGRIASRLPDLKTFDGEPIVFDWEAHFAHTIRGELAPLADVVELFQRLRQWDYLNTPTSDGPYWKGEIDAALDKLEKLT